MKRLPKSILVDGKRWRVILKPLAHRGLYGLCLPRTREIHIDCDLLPAERNETFLHEVMHACLQERWAPKTEEYMIRRLSPRLLAALQGIGWLA